MRCFEKLFIIIISFMFVYTSLKADDTFDLSSANIKCDEAKTAETVSKCHATIEYCWGQNKRESAEYTGCFFNKNDPKYTTTTLDADNWYDNQGGYIGKPKNDNKYYKDNNGNVVSDANFKDSLYYYGGPNDAWANIYGMTFRIYNNIPYERTYSAIVSGTNEVTSLACYKGYAKVRENHNTNYLYGVEEKNNPYETIAFDVVPDKCDYKKNQDCMGPVLIFKLFYPNSNNGCSMRMVKMILPTTFNTEQKNASTNLLKTSVAKKLWASDSYYDETDSGLIFPPWYVSGNNTNYAKLRTDSKCIPYSECKNNACDFCYTDLNRVNYDEIHVNTHYGREIAYGNKTYGGKNIYNNGLGLNDSALKLDPDNARCPEYFYINPNVGGDYVNKYRVSNNENDNKYEGKNYSLQTFLKDLFTEGNIYDNGTHYKGCTSDDVVDFEEMKKCFQDAEKSIMSKSCPSDIKDFTEFANSLESLQSKCKNEYNDLYARFLMLEENQVLDAMLKEAKNKKIDECYYNYCNFTKAEKDAIAQELAKSENKDCASGCRTAIHNDSTKETEGKCIACGGSQGVVYYWRSKDAAIGNTCTEVNLPYDKCFGNSKADACKQCLSNVYSKLNISDDKIKCMDDALADREKAKNDTDGIIDQQSQDYTDETTISNAERASDPFTYFRIPGLEDGGFGPKGQNCDEVLQDAGKKIIKGIINALRIAGAIIAIANAMIVLVPAIISKDADGLKKAGRKLIVMAVVLAIIGILPSIVNLIGMIFGYDLSCLM